MPNAANGKIPWLCAGSEFPVLPKHRKRCVSLLSYCSSILLCWMVQTTTNSFAARALGRSSAGGSWLEVDRPSTWSASSDASCRWRTGTPWPRGSGRSAVQACLTTVIWVSSMRKFAWGSNLASNHYNRLKCFVGAKSACFYLNKWTRTEYCIYLRM